MPRRSVSEMFDRLAQAESLFVGQEFLAPIIAGGEVRVRIAGIICQMHIEPADFCGWGVFRPLSTTQAEFRRPPSLLEQQTYLRLFPQVQLVLCGRRSVGPRETLWHAMPAHRGDNRLQIEGAVPVRMVEDAETFDVVQTRFDGTSFWFESLDAVRDPATAAFLRQSLREQVAPSGLKRSGLTPEERSAYTMRWKARQAAQKRQERDQTETRLRSALAHAGAQFVDYLERPDGYRVTYRIGQRQMVTSVDKQDLSVQVAGICLSGEDQKFDLSSLVGVLHEGAGHTVAIGQDNRGLPEEAYWSMYRR